jgi:hypothetical protein
MIRVRPAVFANTCAARGYDLAAAMQCVVQQLPTVWIVDETHPAYPRRVAQPACHAGTHLSRLLERFGITYTPGCKCRSMAAKMDNQGCEWCESEAGIAEILEAMRTEASKRGLPFLDGVGKMLVRQAVRSARRETERAEKASEAQSQEPPAV